MKNLFEAKIPNLLVMVRPTHFQFNKETAKSNHFQISSSEKVDHEQVLTEFDGVVEVLEHNKIRLKVFEDNGNGSPDSIFLNNWLVQVPGGPITLFPMLAANRKKEVRMDVVSWLLSNSTATELVDLRELAKGNQVLEGTGSIVFDHFRATAYSCISSRTNLELLDTYMKRIGYTSISFESLDLSGQQVYHTNVMMAMGARYALINLDSIEHPVEKKMCRMELERSGKEVIEISHQQMNAFAGNVMEVMDTEGGVNLILGNAAYESLSVRQIDMLAKYVELIKVNIPTIEKYGGGGIRCMLAGMFA